MKNSRKVGGFVISRSSVRARLPDPLQSLYHQWITQRQRLAASSLLFAAETVSGTLGSRTGRELQPATTGARRFAPITFRSASHTSAALLAGLFSGLQAHAMYIPPYIPVAFWRAAPCRAVQGVHLQPSLFATGFVSVLPRSAASCRTVPMRIAKGPLSMGFKRSRVQISPARFFEHRNVRNGSGAAVQTPPSSARQEWVFHSRNP